MTCVFFFVRERLFPVEYSSCIERNDTEIFVDEKLMGNVDLVLITRTDEQHTSGDGKCASVTERKED